MTGPGAICKRPSVSESSIDVAVDVAHRQTGSKIHGLNELPIKLADLRKNFISPLAPRRVR